MRKMFVNNQDGDMDTYVHAEDFYKNYVAVTLSACVRIGEVHYDTIRHELMNCFIEQDGYILMDASDDFVETVQEILQTPYEQAFNTLIDYSKNLPKGRVIAFPIYNPAPDTSHLAGVDDYGSKIPSIPNIRLVK